MRARSWKCKRKSSCFQNTSHGLTQKYQADMATVGRKSQEAQARYNAHMQSLQARLDAKDFSWDSDNMQFTKEIAEVQ